MHFTWSAGARYRPGSSGRCGTISIPAVIGTCPLASAASRTANGEPVANTADTGCAVPFTGAPACEQAAPTQRTARNQLDQISFGNYASYFR